MKKIGILTFHNGPNYGGFLQAWHMQKAIEELGYDARVINYQNPEHASSEKPRLTSVSLAGLKGFVWNWIKSQPFKRPISELSLGRLQTDASKIDWHSYDAIVVGSDVVWDYRNPRYGADPCYFGAHRAQQGVPFIAYAASCGEASLSDARPEFLEEGLKSFEKIFVRDDNTASIVKNIIDLDPDVVCDPTWLNTSEPEVEEESLPKVYDEPYIAVYGPHLGEQRIDALRTYARAHGLKIVSAGSPCRGADKVFRSLRPAQWLGLLRHAEGVMTSTLHGSHYAMKFERPMVFLEAPNSILKARKAIEMAGRINCWVPMGNDVSQEHLERFLGAVDKVSAIPSDWIEQSREKLKVALAEATSGITSANS